MDDEDLRVQIGSDVRRGRLFPVGRRRFGLRDRLDDLPAGWCRLCGMEVWTQGREVCPRCGEAQSLPYVKERPGK